MRAGHAGPCPAPPVYFTTATRPAL